MNLPAFFWRLQTKESVLSVNKSKNTGEKTFNEHDFDIESNHELIKDKKNIFGVNFLGF